MNPTASSGTNYPPFRRPSIGDYCLFYKPDVSPLAWPAFMCPDHFAPSSVLKGRPGSQGCFHLIILIKENLEFCFALTAELLVFKESRDVDHNPDLRLAFELVYKALGCDNALEYWEAQTEQLRAPRVSPKREKFSDSEELYTSDEQSWIPRKRNQLKRPPDRPDKKQELPTSLDAPPRQSLHRKRSPPTSTADIRRHFPPASAMPIHNPKMLPLRPAVQPEDVVEGELTKSNRFVKIHIGPDEVEHLILFDDIKNWDHLFNYRHGRRKFDGRNTDTIELPILKTISPEDFRYAAEFFSTRGFGIRIIDNENRDTAVAECIAAWEVADKLCMEDMLVHVANKFQETQPWKLEEVTYFAGVVYKTAASIFQCHGEMKELLSEYISARYYDLIKEYGDEFTSKMRDIAELERDVFKKLTIKAQQKMEK